MSADTKIVVDYWTNLYDEYKIETIARVTNLARDLIKNLQPITRQAIETAEGILEFGCGTGHACVELADINKSERKVVGVEISKTAVDIAEKCHRTNPRVSILNKDILTDDLGKKFGFGLVFSSNTIEHFMNPWIVVDRLFYFAPKVLLLLPYDEKNLTDGYGGEGGAGHVYSFNENSFSDYKVLEWFTFFSHEWLIGEDPKQMAILIEKK
jgi:SAM-dependent methyltransferase